LLPSKVTVGAIKSGRVFISVIKDGVAALTDIAAVSAEIKIRVFPRTGGCDIIY